jgi:septal ring factor EnvC (AmiA/AmiB activator)
MPPQMVLVTILAVLGSVAFLSMMQISTLRRRLTGKEQELASLLAQNATLNQEIAQLEQEQKTLEGRLTTLRDQLTASSTERDRIRAAMEELQTRYKTLADENARFQQQMDRLVKEKEEVAAQLQTLLKDKSFLEQAATKLRNRLSFLDRDYRQLEAAYTELKQARPAAQGTGATARYEPPSAPPTGNVSQTPAATPNPLPSTMMTPTPPMTTSGAGRPSIELAPIVVRRAQAEVLRQLQTRVVEVNDVHQFVVLGKGSDDGVQIGMNFDVLRGGAKVGEVVVIRVQPQLAAAEIVPAKTSGRPQVGDMAIKAEL